MPCVACGKLPVDRCHIKSRGAGGTWAETNILLLCRGHHIESHQIGWAKFIRKFPAVGKELERKGWSLTIEFGIPKLRLVKGGHGG